MMPIYFVDKCGYCQKLEWFDPKYALPTHKHFSKVACMHTLWKAISRVWNYLHFVKRTVIIIIVWKGGNWVKSFTSELQTLG